VLAKAEVETVGERLEVRAAVEEKNLRALLEPRPASP